MDFSKQLFRCSSLGYIMSEPKEKSNLEKWEDAGFSYNKKVKEIMLLSDKAVKGKEKMQVQIDKLKTQIETLEPIKDIPNLSETCKTHLCDIYTLVKYGRTEDIKSKYMEKGLHMEEDAITLYSLVTGNYHEKCTEYMFNEYIDGHMDFPSTDDFINDTKVNWSIFQFNRVKAKPIKPLYDWQLKGYCWLWKKTKGRLIYCLLDTPEHLIESEQTKLMYELFGNKINYDYSSDELKAQYKEACKEIRYNHTYDDIPEKERVVIFENELTEYDVERIKKRVEDCRWFLNQLEQNKIKDYETEN